MPGSYTKVAMQPRGGEGSKLSPRRGGDNKLQLLGTARWEWEQLSLNRPVLHPHPAPSPCSHPQPTQWAPLCMHLVGPGQDSPTSPMTGGFKLRYGAGFTVAKPGLCWAREWGLLGQKAGVPRCPLVLAGSQPALGRL